MKIGPSCLYTGKLPTTNSKSWTPVFVIIGRIALSRNFKDTGGSRKRWVFCKTLGTRLRSSYNANGKHPRLWCSQRALEQARVYETLRPAYKFPETNTNVAENPSEVA